MAEFAVAKTGTLKVALNLDSDANIAQSGAAVADTKMISINGFKADGNLEQADTVFNALLTEIAGGTYDTLTTTKTITVGVVTE